ncbi:MAG: bifunctional phosphoribosylaminoimidazolecarboxamide formyltransferase/IMP cyclohydrolase [Chitinophagaceae bacterium]|nr:bifunctional phosphoribosylaminoimidazolecarboxamide formyltransferase/IMP cyclohydrolase [Chitinophagaceae bacterium]
MNKKIQSALISVFYKDGLENIVQLLAEFGVTIYSTGGTQAFIEKLGHKVVPVEDLTTYPSILGGRVKTLHPSVFGGILGKRDDAQHLQEMKQYNIPEIDLVIVDLYPFEETVASTTDEKAIIEKIDIGGPSMIRGAAKNHKDVTVVANKRDYTLLENILKEQNGETSLDQRRMFAIKAFDVCTAYDTAISNYFHQLSMATPFNKEEKILRYGENPHQKAVFFGNLDELFDQLNGKELSYNNLVDVDAAMQLIRDAAPPPPEGGISDSNSFTTHNSNQTTETNKTTTVITDSKNPPSEGREAVFAIIKHTNVCGIAQRPTIKESWEAALAGDPESAFGGVLICNGTIDKATAEAINEIFFEVLIAPSFDEDALLILKSKKNRILLKTKTEHAGQSSEMFRSLLNGVLVQGADEGNFADWKEAGARESTAEEKEDLFFSNLVCKHLKSNAIALVKNKQLIGKGCGQTSRIDSLRQALEKAKQFNFNLDGAVMASDAFFPFDDCVKLGHEAGITAFIQPGGSIRDNDSIEYCKTNNLAMVITGIRHFKH